MKNKVMTVLAILLTGCGLVFNMQYVFSKGLQIGINEERYERNVFIDDSYNRGLTKGIKYGMLLRGQKEYIEMLINKAVNDTYTKAFFEGYSKGVGAGVAEGWEKCKKDIPECNTAAPQSESLFQGDN